jgi:hypothetical protein
MLRLTLLCAGLTLTCSILTAQPTWNQDVAPVIYKHCLSCHVDGGIAPFPLTTYAQAASMRSTIAEAVEHREMPPFPADTKVRSYAHQRTMSDAEIATIVAWAKAGGPEGVGNAPPLPEIETGPRIKDPDLIITMPSYTSSARTNDVYRCFSMPVGNTADRMLEHVEVVPGNRGIVHHVLVFVDTSSVTEALQNADPEPGYVGFGGIGSNTATLVGAWVPGMEPIRFPSGFGVRMPRHSRMIFQIHYPAGTVGEVDQTHVRATYSQHPSPRTVYIEPALHYGNMTDGPLVILPNRVQAFHQRVTIPIDVSILTITPHMHLLGKSARVWAVTPKGDTIHLIHIPHWDFHWQLVYMFKSMQRLPAGSRVESEFVYDNTSNNHDNPNDPPRLVTWGEETTDEMMLTFVAYVLYRPGDENIRLDNGATGAEDPSSQEDQSLRIAPNPASSTTVLSMELDHQARVFITIADVSGRRLAAIDGGLWSTGLNTFPLDVADLATGQYVVSVSVRDPIEGISSSRSTVLSVIR